MKRILLLGLLLAPGVLTVAPVWARGCSRGANCTACKNCNGCAWCHDQGGTCSVCRPDLYRRAAGSPAQTYSPPVYQQPQQAPRRIVTPRAAVPRAVPRRQRQSRRSITVPARWSGRVVGVADGDTITVLYGQSPIRIRLYGVDAPEKAQPFGQASKQLTSQLAFGKTATIYSKGSDRYGRVLAWVFVGTTGVNREVVRSGLAWWYRAYSPGESGLQVLEGQARAAHRGLWAQARPVAPWDYRRGQR